MRASVFILGGMMRSTGRLSISARQENGRDPETTRKMRFTSTCEEVLHTWHNI